MRGIGVARERQHVDRAPELLEPLLGRDAEPLLLVDHDQAEVLERDVLRQQPVGADDDVDRPVGEARDRRLLLLRGHEPRQQPDGQRERREPLGERLEVLAGEHGRRHEHRDLLAVLGRLERGPQRDLGLAVADVADDQPVHRPARLHVDLDLFGRAQLVGRLLVRERRLHLRLPRRVGRVREPLGRLALRVQRQQLLGEVVDRLADPLLRPQPVGAAEAAERRVLAARVAATRG